MYPNLKKKRVAFHNRKKLWDQKQKKKKGFTGELPAYRGPNPKTELKKKKNLITTLTLNKNKLSSIS